MIRRDGSNGKLGGCFSAISAAGRLGPNAVYTLHLTSPFYLFHQSFLLSRRHLPLFFLSSLLVVAEVERVSSIGRYIPYQCHTNRRGEYYPTRFFLNTLPRHRSTPISPAVSPLAESGDSMDLS